MIYNTTKGGKMEDKVIGDGWIFGKVDEAFKPVHNFGTTKYPMAEKIVDQLVGYPIEKSGISAVIKLVFDEPQEERFLSFIADRARRYALRFYNCRKDGWRLSRHILKDGTGVMFCRKKV